MENNKLESVVSEEAITYIIMLSALQVVYNCQLELKDTKYYSKNVKVKCNEAITAMNQSFQKDHRKIWQIDEKMSADFMKGISSIGEQIAKTNGLALPTITDLIRKNIDFSKYKLVEIGEDDNTQ